MERLLHRRDFIAAAKGRFTPSGGVLLQMRKRDDDGPARLGFTCTKKLGNAVTRNRIRRRIKEAARLCLPPIVRWGHDYVLIGRQSAEGRAFEALQKDIISACAKLHDQAG